MVRSPQKARHKKHNNCRCRIQLIARITLEHPSIVFNLILQMMSDDKCIGVQPCQPSQRRSQHRVPTRTQRSGGSQGRYPALCLLHSFCMLTLPRSAQFRVAKHDSRVENSDPIESRKTHVETSSLTFPSCHQSVGYLLYIYDV